MASLEWSFPRSLNEAVRLLSKGKAIIHSGGTALVKSSLNGTRIVDLGALPLRFVRIKSGIVTIGAMTSFQEVIDSLKKIDPNSILIKSLSSMVLPLRNRVTIGGSVAYAPAWSDLVGPLVALNASMKIAGLKKNIPIEMFLKNRSRMRRSIIEAVTFKREGWKSEYIRVARTAFDYSAFNISVLLKAKQPTDAIAKCRVVVYGGKVKIQRLFDLEERLLGKKLDEISSETLVSDIKFTFPRRRLGSPEYLETLARVELGRALIRLSEG